MTNTYPVYKDALFIIYLNFFRLICSTKIDSALVIHPLQAKQSFKETVAFFYYYWVGFIILGWIQFWEGLI